MLNKVTCGMITDGDIEAVSSARKFDISTGGWTPKEHHKKQYIDNTHLYEELYEVKEYENNIHHDVIEQNIIESHGMLMFSYNGSNYHNIERIRYLSDNVNNNLIKYNKPMICHDGSWGTIPGETADWINRHDIKILNIVADSRDVSLHYNICMDIRLYLFELFIILGHSPNRKRIESFFDSRYIEKEIND